MLLADLFSLYSQVVMDEMLDMEGVSVGGFKHKQHKVCR